MVWQLAEPEYEANIISDWRVGGNTLRASRLASITDPRFTDYIPQRLNYYSAI